MKDNSVNTNKCFPNRNNKLHALARLTAILPLVLMINCIKFNRDSDKQQPPSDLNASANEETHSLPKTEKCNKEDFTPAPINTIHSIHIERHFQRVQQFDCKGTVVSDKDETVKSPWGGFINIRLTEETLKKIKDNYPPKYKGKWEVINRQLCEDGRRSVGTIHEYDTEAQLFIDMAPGWLSFQVQNGINIIDYQFHICDKVNEKSECIENLVEESGTLTLNIDYVEKKLDGIKEVRPPSLSCEEGEEKKKK